MNILNKNQTIIIFLCVIIGILIGLNSFVARHAGLFITPFLMLMLFGLFLNIPIHKLRESFLNYRFSLTSIVLNFVVTPLLAYGLGALFLSGHLSLWIGFIMLMVTPCTDWYMIFTGIAKGNVPLSTSMLPINFILQVILLPVYLLLYFGNTGSLDLFSVLQSMLVVIVIPFVLAFATKTIIRKENTLDRVKSFFESYQVIFLGLAIVAMFASEGKLMLDNLGSIYILLFPVILFFILNYFISTAVARIFRYSYEDYTSLVFITMARNSPIALAIAVTAFSDQPLIALSLIIGPLLELPVLAIVSQVQLWKRGRLERED